MALNLALDADQKMLLSGTIHANIKHADRGQALKPFGLAQRHTGLFDADVNLALVHP